MAEKHISIPKPFCTGDISEWFLKFEICCKANTWNAETKAVKLPTLLEGEALAVWLEMSEEDQTDYKKAKEKLCKKLTPMEFVSLDDFHKRKLRPGEALSLFYHDLKKLLSLAMPTLEAAGQKQLLLHQLLAGLPTAVSRQLRATGDTNDIDNVLERARLLLMMDEQQQLAAVSEGSSKPTGELQHLQQQIAELTEQVAMLTTASQPANVPRCFNCQQPGHFQRQCPHLYPQRRNQQRQCYNCGKFGHIERDCRSRRSGNDYGTSPVATRRPRP